MTFEETIKLSPFEKYQQFGHFPWKFILHLILIFMTTYQIEKVFEQRVNYNGPQYKVFRNLFLEEVSDREDWEDWEVEYYDLEEIQQQFLGICENLQDINEELIPFFDLAESNYQIDVYYKSSDVNNYNFMNKDVNLLDCNFGFFDAQNLESIKEFFSEILFMSIHLENLISLGQKNGDDKCNRWFIDINYDFQNHIFVEASINVESDDCVTGYLQYDEGLYFVHSIMRILYRKEQKLKEEDQQEFIFQRTQTFKMDYLQEDQKYNFLVKNVNEKWEKLTISQKLSFFNKWFLVAILAHFFQMMQMVSYIEILYNNSTRQDGYDDFLTQQEYLVGLGSILQWISMYNYMQYDDNINRLTTTIRRVSSSLLTFFIGAVPIFLAFTMLVVMEGWDTVKKDKEKLANNIQIEKQNKELSEVLKIVEKKQQIQVQDYNKLQVFNQYKEQSIERQFYEQNRLVNQKFNNIKKEFKNEQKNNKIYLDFKINKNQDRIQKIFSEMKTQQNENTNQLRNLNQNYFLDSQQKYLFFLYELRENIMIQKQKFDKECLKSFY
ncbi:hypothetical protein PPERSA_11949 [Pseudocohnilembus persalinus]|uniref:Polycystin cation channel PKD1/PKD2 domain-containing protein n=1 Tax=Pseudocohnilembus persalinus TaxID=266149 RepID=A0A0V0QKA0_PSEPJ|nr:hypothetical protein PPERSA_11949 [Pseudocohnilembus persalinus]|eukprot:KRX02609.1 hypothetical protein PPERSA_11949 [Pseudocohnilembus persalinus]